MSLLCGSEDSWQRVEIPQPRNLLGSRWLSFLLVFAVLQMMLSIVKHSSHQTIIIITPTYPRPERLADMTRLAQTLRHVENLHWVVIEDGYTTVPVVERLLIRSRIPYVYFSTTSEPGYPRRGWTHRNVALDYIRRAYADYRRPGVVYFADDDNAYDLRLFDNYIRHVKTIGFWAVGEAFSKQRKTQAGLSGGAFVEAPHVKNGTIVAWDTVYAPNRTFATDMAGFAVNLQLVLKYNAKFNCTAHAPEPCFLKQFGVGKETAQAFGYDSEPKEILVWHTKTKKASVKGDTYGYIMEKDMPYSGPQKLPPLDGA